MAISVNKAIIAGHVGREPEVRGQQGDIVTLSVATSETWRDDRGEKQERTQWHKVVIFNKQIGQYVTQYVNKGDFVFVEGQIETRKWERENGLEPVYFTEIVVRPYSGSVQALKKNAGTGEKDNWQAPQPSQPAQSSHSSHVQRSALEDDEIPF